MLINKSIILLILSLGFSNFSSESRKLVVTYYQEPEILNGRIKQLIEIRPTHDGDVPELCPIDTTNFDKKGDAIETILGTNTRTCVVNHYLNKYDKDGNKTETIVNGIDNNDKVIYKFNCAGYLLESEYGNNKGRVYKENAYRYDKKGYIIEMIHYSDLSRVLFKEKYKYNKTGNLIERDLYKRGTEFMNRIHYTYLSFDKKANWTKRIVTREDVRQGIVEKHTIIHKIFYY